jgi:hypothetical protein
MQRNRLLAALTVAGLGAALAGPTAPSVSANHGEREFTTTLISYNEVPSVSSTARGSFRARLNREGTELSYRLTFSGLSATITMAHIHFGAHHTNGAIMVWLCQSSTNTDPTGLAPTCPQEGTVEGVIKAANIVQPGAQGIAAGEFDEFVRALRADRGYANVHSQMFPSGEIRGQIK